MSISVAMTTYNGEMYIEKQLMSLLNQTVKPDEVIIADDCSKDNTAVIINSFIKKNNLNNWTFYVNDNNMGFIKNFKNVIRKTTGDIIFLCDQDDIWLPNKIEEISELFFKNADALAINSGFNFIDGEDNSFNIPQKNGFSNQNIIQYTINNSAFEKIRFDTIIRYNISPGCTMAFRKEVKEKLLNQNEFVIPHDWEINLIACADDGLYFYNKAMINYRIHNANTIGLKTDEESKALKIQGDLKKRLDVLDCMINLSGLLLTPEYFDKTDKKNKSYIKNINKFVRVRLKVLKDKSFASWLKLWTIAPYIKQKNTVKTICGDLIFMINMQKAFQDKTK